MHAPTRSQNIVHAQINTERNAVAVQEVNEVAGMVHLTGSYGAQILSQKI